MSREPCYTLSRAGGKEAGVSDKKVIVIDDEAQVAEMISEFFVVFGFKTMILTDGKDVLNQVKAFGPDLITLDLMMPDVSGFEVLAMLKRDEATHNIPVVIITAATEDLGRLEDTFKQCRGILPKPVKMKTLHERIAKIVAA